MRSLPFRIDSADVLKASFDRHELVFLVMMIDSGSYNIKA